MYNKNVYWSYVWKLHCKCYIRPKMFKKIKLELTENCPGWFPQCWKVFAVLWGETPSMALPRDDYWMPWYWPAWQGIVRCSKAAWRLWGQPTSFWFDLRPIPQETIHAWCDKWIGRSQAWRDSLPLFHWTDMLSSCPLTYKFIPINQCLP